jgi:prepilin-type N-terminal cleavage/methylation domain-containing protein
MYMTGKRPALAKYAVTREKTLTWRPTGATLMRNERGITLVELLVVITIVAVLATMFIPRMIGYREQAQRARGIALLQAVYNGVAAYEAHRGTLEGLPYGWGYHAWTPLRDRLRPYVTLPSWGEVHPELIETLYVRPTTWVDGTAAYKVSMVFSRTTDGAGWRVYIGTPGGVWQCAHWHYEAAACRRP